MPKSYQNNANSVFIRNTLGEDRQKEAQELWECIKKWTQFKERKHREVNPSKALY